MKKITLWRPSTCKCEIEYEWDTDTPDHVRTHKIVSFKHCGENHPVLAIGETLDGSDFHKDHVMKNQKEKVN